MLDRFLPNPRLIELDHVDVAAPPAAAYAAMRHFDGARSPFVHGLFALRVLPQRLLGEAPPELSLRIDDMHDRPGFRVLAEEPGVAFAVGAIGRFWETEIPFQDVPPESFRAFDQPGWGKVAWAVRILPWGAGGARVIFELRVSATSEDAWEQQRRYFRLIGPFSHLIRRHVLSLLAQELGAYDAAAQGRPLPGDELVPTPRAQVTHGITISAPPERIWPWLVQMGCQRGGWYSYDLLDNGGQPSAREIQPALQRLQVGDVLPATPTGEEGFTVLRIDPGRALVLGGTYDLDADGPVAAGAPLPERYWRVSWAFALEPLDPETTQLLVRARVDYAPDSVAWRAAWMRPVHHFMQAEQLRTLKRRAEGHAEDGWRDVGVGIAGAMGMVVNMATPFLRQRRARWGLDEATAARGYPGDERVPEPSWSWCHGVEIEAPVEAVWPWVAQIGQGQAGFYSYQWLENLVGCDIQNAERIHPEWQEVRPGNELRLHGGTEGPLPPLSITAVEPGRWFLACGGPAPRLSWLFFVEPLGPGRSRFISRFRIEHTDDLRGRMAFGPLLIEPIGFMMDRRMLLGVKERAERGPAQH